MSHQVNDEFYVYVFVRKNLSHPQQIVQACHAVAEVTRYCPPPDGVIPNLVLLGVNDESRLFKCQSKLDKANIRYKVFFEPDINQFTALATEPVSGETRQHFRNYTLLSSEPVLAGGSYVG